MEVRWVCFGPRQWPGWAAEGEMDVRCQRSSGLTERTLRKTRAAILSLVEFQMNDERAGN